MRLPPEIWEQIFLYVQQQDQWSFNNSDLLSCSKTCRQFQNILEGRKTTWLFKYVMPHLFSSLNKPTLLSLRMVCKSWKRVMDNFLTNYETCWEATQYKQHLRHHRTVQEDFHPLGNHQWLTKFSGNWKLQQFLNQEYPHNYYCGSFPGGSVVVSFQSSIWNFDLDQLSPDVLENADREQNKFWNLLLELLLRMGDKISYLKIRIRSHEPVMRVINVIVECLNHAPNLRRLYLDIHFAEKPSSFAQNHDITSSLPSLSHLESLEFAHTYLSSSGYPLADHFQNQFAARYLPQLKRLQLCLNQVISNTEYFRISNNTEILNVTVLELKVACKGQFKILEYFQSPGTQPKLKKLSLHLMFNFVKHINVTFQKIVKHIFPFSASLEVLNIFGIEIYLNRKSYASRVRYGESLEPLSHFCKLKILHLHGFVFDRLCALGYDTPMHFFNNMPKSLEYFYIQSDHFHGIHRDLRNYNVKYSDYFWRFCPNLRCIRIAEEFQYGWDNDGNFIENGANTKTHCREEWEFRNMLKEKKKDGLNQVSNWNGRCCCTLM